jgi:hypothetical protein
MLYCEYMWKYTQIYTYIQLYLLKSCTFHKMYQLLTQQAVFLKNYKFNFSFVQNNNNKN